MKMGSSRICAFFCRLFEYAAFSYSLSNPKDVWRSEKAYSISNRNDVRRSGRTNFSGINIDDAGLLDAEKEPTHETETDHEIQQIPDPSLYNANPTSLYSANPTCNIDQV